MVGLVVGRFVGLDVVGCGAVGAKVVGLIVGRFIGFDVRFGTE